MGLEKKDCIVSMVTTLFAGIVVNNYVAQITRSYLKYFNRVVTRMDTLKSGWTHYVYYTAMFA